MTVKSPQKLKRSQKILENEPISFSLRQALKPLLKSFSKTCEESEMILHFDIPVHIPDLLQGDPHLLRSLLNKTFKRFLAKSIDAGSDQVLQGGIQMEKRRNDLGQETLILNFIFESINEEGRTNNEWTTEHCSLHFQVAPFSDDILNQGTSLNTQSLNLSHLRCLLLTTPETYSHLIDILQSWKVSLHVMTQIPQILKNEEALPEHDVILITNQVGTLSGYEVAKEIKIKAPQSPLILISAQPQRGDALKCRELGIHSYLSYPLQPIELWEAIKKVYKTSAKNLSELVTKHSLREEESRLNILLIPSGDMDFLELSDIGGILLSHGHRVTMITKPDELKKLPFSSNQFDLIVTDNERREQLLIQKIQTPIVTFDPETFSGSQSELLDKIEHLN